jgi:hypothetical protein
MMKFPNFGQRRSNQSSIDDVSNAQAPIQPEDNLEDEMANLSAEEAAEIRDAFNVILHSDQEDPMLETAADIEEELVAEPEFMAMTQVQSPEPELNGAPALMAKFDLDITPLIVPTVITESIEVLDPYSLSQDFVLAEGPIATKGLATDSLATDSLATDSLATEGLAAEGLDLDIPETATDSISTNETGDPEAGADSSYDIHTDGPLTYFQYYLDGESGEAAEYNPVSLRRPSMPTGLVGAGILGAALISGFSIADAMKQGQPVAKRPTPSPLQDLKTQATPPPVVPAPPESLQPEISALPPAPQVNRAALGAGPVGAANLPIVPPPAPAMNAISQPTYSLQQGGGMVTSIAPVSRPQTQESPAPLNEVQTPSAPVVNMPPNPQILPPPPLPSGILSEPQPVVVTNIPDPVVAAPEVNPAVQASAVDLQPVQAITPEVMATPPEMSQPKVGILPRPNLPSAGPVPANLPEVLPALDRLSNVTTTIREPLVSGNDLVFDRKPMPPGAIESPQVVVRSGPAEGALQTLLTPPQNKGFLADDVTLRSLSQQEANLLTQANGIEPFTKRTLTIRDYARAYQVASKQVNGLPPFGFIDYQQRAIILPDEAATVSSTAPASGVPQS